MRRTGLVLVGVLLAACGSPAPDSATPATSAPGGGPDVGAIPDRTPGPTRASARPAPSRAANPERPVRSTPRVRRGWYAVDGDTISRGRIEVRVIGIDTPEYGECGFTAAKTATARFIAPGVALVDRAGRDRYGRVLASVTDARGRDLGVMLIRRGLANARYDSTDGYPWHPRERQYRRLDGRTRHLCGRPADGLGGPEPYRLSAGSPYPACAAAESAGAAPLRRGDPGWNPDLDGDGDGVACE